MGSQVLGWILASRAHSRAAGPNVIRHRRMSRQLVVEDLNLRVVVHDYVVLPGCVDPESASHFDSDPRSGGITR